VLRNTLRATYRKTDIAFANALNKPNINALDLTRHQLRGRSGLLSSACRLYTLGDKKIPLKNQLVIYIHPEAGRDCAISEKGIQ